MSFFFRSHLPRFSGARQDASRVRAVRAGGPGATTRPGDKPKGSEAVGRAGEHGQLPKSAPHRYGARSVTTCYIGNTTPALRACLSTKPANVSCPLIFARRALCTSRTKRTGYVPVSALLLLTCCRRPLILPPFIAIARRGACGRGSVQDKAWAGERSPHGTLA